MNWRRGLLLAGIHLVVAAPLIFWLSADDAKYVKENYVPHQSSIEAPPSKQNDETITFDPCRMWVHYPPKTTIVRLANFPSSVLTNWRLVCPAKWSVSGIFQVNSSWTLTPSSVATQKRVDLVFILLIFVQWLFVGGFPFRSKQWWREPGVVITIGAVLSGILVIIPNHGLATGPALLAWYAWLWWFGLLIWKMALAVWRAMARIVNHNSRRG